MNLRSGRLILPQFPKNQLEKLPSPGGLRKYFSNQSDQHVACPKYEDNTSDVDLLSA